MLWRRRPPTPTMFSGQWETAQGSAWNTNEWIGLQADIRSLCAVAAGRWGLLPALCAAQKRVG